MHETPTAERILSLLADLYADQTGTEITYEITEGCAAPSVEESRNGYRRREARNAPKA